MVVTTEPDRPALPTGRRRRMTREQAVRLQRIARRYRFGVPDLS